MLEVLYCQVSADAEAIKLAELRERIQLTEFALARADVELLEAQIVFETFVQRARRVEYWARAPTMSSASVL